MAYYLVIALQFFCVYHLYKNKNAYYWLFLIIFLPLVGCAIYLITQVYNKRDVDKIQQEITTIINPTKKIKDLEKALVFSETFQNRVNLADAFFEIKDYNNAIIHYEKSISKDFHNDKYVVLQLINSYHFINDYEKVVSYSERVKDTSDFKGSQSQFFYGLSLTRLGQNEKAEEHLKAIDVRYSNYEERLILAQYLISQNKDVEAKELLNEIFVESQHMSKPNKQKYKYTIKQVEQLLNTM